MDKVAVVAITKNGTRTARRIKGSFAGWSVFAPEKFSDGSADIAWYSESTAEKIAKLFKENDALVCIFSLGAAIRLIAPYIKSKKTDPAVVVIDDNVDFVISALSGHLGGANELARMLAARLDSVPVITTAADVNKTIPVDLVGRKLGWTIDDESTVTRVSAYMVNGEKIGVFQDAGSTGWYEKLPENVELFGSIKDMAESDARGFLIITDKILRGDFLRDSVVYRPPSLVVGVGLHRDTQKETIINGIKSCMSDAGLALKSVAELASIKKPQDIQGLQDAGEELGIDVRYVSREELSEITTPNPSDVVRSLEGTASVSEAAAIKASQGSLIVEKQKFPPDLTIAVARKTR